MRKTFLGEALPKRPEQKTSKLSDTGGFVSNLDGVSVDVRTIGSGGTYSMPTLVGAEFNRMRRYGLVLNRWAISDRARRAKRTGKPESAYIAASRAVANHMFGQVFDGEDPTTDTINITPYVNAIKSGAVTPELLQAVSALHGTDAFASILDALPPVGVSAIVKEQMLSLSETLGRYYLGGSAYYWEDLNGIHSTSKTKQRRAYAAYQAIVDVIYHTSRSAVKSVEEHKRKKHSVKKNASGKQVKNSDEQQVNGIPQKTIIQLAETGGSWMTPYLAKYPLELPHTGKLGRREIATNEGKYPKAFYRLVTDPYRRIFKRKTRALGGVVVFDCSGSMGLTEDDIRRVLNASAGCSIICYSSSGEEDYDRKHGNIHIVAKNGRQMRYLPEFPGGNGVDYPALRYGYDHLRQNAKSPVIWVSDGQVTGSGDVSTSDLRQQVNRYRQQRNIIRVNDPDEAIELLTKLQKGIKS